jgi:hypothetical protein
MPSKQKALSSNPNIVPPGKKKKKKEKLILLSHRGYTREKEE